jgi:hypothetical protein
MFACAALLAVVVAAGCDVDVGDVQTVDRTVELDDAETVIAEFGLSAGDLELSGGAKDLMEARFRFNVDAIEPDVDYAVRGDEGDLSVRQPRTWFTSFGPDVVNEWTVGLSDEAPIELRVETSSGRSELDLADLDVVSVRAEASSGNTLVYLDGEHPSLERVDVSVSSGQIELDLTGEYEDLRDVDLEASSGTIRVDLSGEWADDCDVTLDASSGSIDVIVPDDVEVRVTAETSSGSVSADGFTLDGDEYTLDGPSGAPTLTIDIDVSSGNVRLEIAS